MITVYLLIVTTYFTNPRTGHATNEPISVSFHDQVSGWEACDSGWLPRLKSLK